MVKKKTPEKKAKRARENGFNDNDNNINDSLVLKEILPYTTRVYNEQMDFVARVKLKRPRTTKFHLCHHLVSLRLFRTVADARLNCATCGLDCQRANARSAPMSNATVTCKIGFVPFYQEKFVSIDYLNHF
jgi:hypothetical protein